MSRFDSLVIACQIIAATGGTGVADPDLANRIAGVEGLR